MKIKISLAQRIFDIFNVLFMLFMVVIMLYPLWHVAMASLSDSNILLGHQGMLLLPRGFNVDAYKAVFTNKMIGVGYKNTLIILIGGLCVNMVMTTLAAYGLSRKNLRLGKFIMKFITITMFISGGLIPSYLLITRTLNMNNSLGHLYYQQLLIPTTSLLCAHRLVRFPRR